MRHQNMTKKEAQRLHSIGRGAERYGMKLSGTDLGKICGLIQTSQSTLVEKQSNRISVHLVTYNGEQIPVVYDKKRKSIATVLPKEAI